MSPIHDLVRVGGAWLGRASAPAGPDFVLGTTEPVGGSNAGAGIYAAMPTVTADAKPGVTYNSTTKLFTVAPGATVEDAVFPGFVNLGDGAQLLNYLITGPDAEVTNNRALLAGPTTSGQARADFGTIAPDVPSPYYDGIGPQGLYVTRTWIHEVTDGVRAFNTSGGTCRMRLEGVHVERMAQFAPDYAYNPPTGRSETHNDGIQCQGNAGGDVNDIYLDGVSINARHSLVSGDIPPYRAQISAVMTTPNVGRVLLTVTRSWLRGGLATVNGGGSTNITAVYTHNRHEKPGTDEFGDGRAPDWAGLIKAGSDTTWTDNTYEIDGTAAAYSAG